ncbi:TPA: nucleotidyltransferase domain-containing protein [Candidatus Bathyarchaeota archaeon]|nr:nucleotidyltransferase domain-containing protein [Candidatus Bathyarchaeota archaeon]
MGRGLPLTEKARAVSNELARREDVLAVILFGSVAKGTARGESDIDLLIVTAREVDLIDEVYGLMARYDVPIEPVVLTYDEFLSTLASESVLLFSILEGYDVLADRGGVRNMLAVKDAKIRGEWVYDEEVGTWFRRSILRT